MEAVFKKTPEYLVIDNQEAQDFFDEVPDGALVKVEYIEKRNYENHKRFFAFARDTFDMQDQFDNKEIWRKHLLMLAGYYDQVVVPIPEKKRSMIDHIKKFLGGPGKAKSNIIRNLESTYTVQYWPKSMSFEKMDEVEFKNMFDCAISGFLERYGNGMTDEEFRRVIDYD